MRLHFLAHLGFVHIIALVRVLRSRFTIRRVCAPSRVDGYCLIQRAVQPSYSVFGFALPRPRNVEEKVGQAVMLSEHCRQNHDRCARRISFFPTGVLDVLVTEQSPDLVRLNEADRKVFVANQVRYATLSWCWGSGNQTTLLRGKEQTLKGGLLITSLPPVFQEAILLTRSLGIRYLW